MTKLVHSVLGTNYDVKIGERADIDLSEEHLGICKVYAKEILVATDVQDCNEEELQVRTQEVVAHEIFHAYLNEAGMELDEDVEERLADFYMKNWRKINNSILEVLDKSGFLDN